MPPGLRRICAVPSPDGGLAEHPGGAMPGSSPIWCHPKCVRTGRRPGRGDGANGESCAAPSEFSAGARRRCWASSVPAAPAGGAAGLTLLPVSVPAKPIWESSFDCSAGDAGAAADPLAFVESSSPPAVSLLVPTPAAEDTSIRRGSPACVPPVAAVCRRPRPWLTSAWRISLRRIGRRCCRCAVHPEFADLEGFIASFTCRTRLQLQLLANRGSRMSRVLLDSNTRITPL